jgi:lysophospholipase L1-like esterase
MHRPWLAIPARGRPSLLLWLVVWLAVSLGTAGCTVWRVDDARDLARQSTPLQQAPADAVRRLLIAGDSTAVGTGASTPASSLAGRLAADHPRLAIENRARDGATWAGTATQLERKGRFDLVLLMAGGNDVIRLRDPAAWRDDLERSVRLALERAPMVVLMPAGNVGNAPFFLPPLSWEMTRRARLLHATVRELARQPGVIHIDLFHERDADPFVRQPEMLARDGLHPSDAGYQAWYQTLMSNPQVAALLAAARDGAPSR